MKVLLWLCLLVAGAAQAQWAQHIGIWHAANGYTELTADRNRELNWMQWHRLGSYNDTGDNVSQYLQHYHWGLGHAFGQVVEVQKQSQDGNSWGIEVDLMTSPVRGNSHYRIGVGVVLGPHGSSTTAPSWASHAFVAMPWAGNPNAKVDYGLEVQLPCEKACVAVPSGERIQLSHDPIVGALRFDPKTGILGFWRKGDFLVWGIQQATGEEFKMRQF